MPSILPTPLRLVYNSKVPVYGSYQVIRFPFLQSGNSWHVHQPHSPRITLPYVLYWWYSKNRCVPLTSIVLSSIRRSWAAVGSFTEFLTRFLIAVWLSRRILFLCLLHIVTYWWTGMLHYRLPITVLWHIFLYCGKNKLFCFFFYKNSFLWLYYLSNPSSVRRFSMTPSQKWNRVFMLKTLTHLAVVGLIHHLNICSVAIVRQRLFWDSIITLVVFSLRLYVFIC